MKEIIQSLNLPKQVLDKTEELMKTLFGPATKELGELFADKMRYRRLKNQINIFNKTVQLLEQNNLKPKELKIKTLVLLLEECSLEEDELLQEKWANLLANIATSPENGLKPRLVKTLSSLNPLEAQILDFSFEETYKNRIEEYERRKNWGRIFDSITLEEIKIEP
ncbi:MULTISPECIES: Abi-alpha family protein [unclassified Spirosoma]|uniref:Abi-alpha family protein n=1 Tax=unclassified Spirosoma TaxID=2621999 RepID=UPI0025F6110E|nr:MULTISPECIES: Abi-alpha family protein [unclassified Spirosoma]